MKKILIFLLTIFLSNSATFGLITKIPRGQVVDTIRCIYNKQQSYSLYLPSYYTTDKKSPIIYIFEPAARGRLPVEKYHQLAEDFGYILVCSNNSRNGLYEPAEIAANAVFSDTKIRFTIDTSRFYTMGFSGGARFATRLAILLKNIKGVISCGAGFPSELKAQKGMNFTFIGLTGTLDMNYSEVKSLDNELDNIGMKHLMIYFEAEHEWPEEPEMRNAFRFLQFDAMQRKLIDIDTLFVEKYKKAKLNEVNSVTNNYNQYIGFEQLIIVLEGLTDVRKIRGKIQLLEADENVKECIKKQHLYLENELNRAEKIRIAFYDKETYPMSWWKSEAKRLNQQAADTTETEFMYIAKRMKNKIYLIAFETYWLSNPKPALAESERLFAMASLAEPQSPYPAYNLAAEYSKVNKKKQAIKMLQQAVDKGFTNLSYLRTDKRFENIRTHEDFIAIEEKIADR